MFFLPFCLGRNPVGSFAGDEPRRDRTGSSAGRRLSSPGELEGITLVTFQFLLDHISQTLIVALLHLLPLAGLGIRPVVPRSPPWYRRRCDHWEPFRFVGKVSTLPRVLVTLLFELRSLILSLFPLFLFFLLSSQIICGSFGSPPLILS